MTASASADYRKQDRGTATSYERYLAGMDASMRQKVALTAAHLLCEGKIADLGMGSGTGSHALAALYPRLQVVGVDVNPTMGERARAQHRLPNLAFVEGDIATPVFPAAHLDSIFDSSVLHHVTSFGGYAHERAARALEVQVQQLREGGVLIVRDFVDPGAGTVVLELPDADGDGSDDPRTCSTANLFERFAREFRSLHATPGFRFERAPDAPEGTRRYRLSSKLAAEFLLRKDYRTDWEAEVQEEYTYFTQAQFEARFAAMGLRVLASTPLWNPWILRHRWTGKFRLFGEAGEALAPPPTNYVIVGEKVPAGEGVRFVEAAPAEPLGFLQLEHHRHKETGQVFDLVRRPNLTLDVVPHFSLGEETFVLARMSYPRPILRAPARIEGATDGSRPADYVTEPLTVLQTEKPMGQTVEEALSILADLPAEQIQRVVPGGDYYPSPGGIQEEVRSVLVEVEPLFVQEQIENLSGFSTSGRVRAMEAQQVLRAAQVGGLPDARLELNVYDLLLRQGRSCGPWIGEELSLPIAPGAPAPTGIEALSGRPPRRVFERVRRSASTGFLTLEAARFDELDAAGKVLHHQVLEYVRPRGLSATTVSAAVLVRGPDGVLIGVDDDDLPAAQAFTGHSQLWVTPAWRLPKAVRTMAEAKDWLRGRLTEEYGLSPGELWELGGSYHPSAGATPEVVYPFAIEVTALASGKRPLCWVPIEQLVASRGILRDGHLRIAALRAAHALDLLPGPAAGATAAGACS
jgi:SAM-dependent methyltransferase